MHTRQRLLLTLPLNYRWVKADRYNNRLADVISHKAKFHRTSWISWAQRMFGSFEWRGVRSTMNHPAGFCGCKSNGLCMEMGVLQKSDYGAISLTIVNHHMWSCLISVSLVGLHRADQVRKIVGAWDPFLWVGDRFYPIKSFSCPYMLLC